MIEKTNLIAEAINNIDDATPNQMERLIHAIEMISIVQKNVLSDEEGRKYANCTKTRWHQLKKDRLFPYNLQSTYKGYVKREELDKYLTRSATAIHSATELISEAKVQLAKRKSKIK